MRLYLAVVALAVLAACSVSYVDNYSFDLWCEDALCSWELEEGVVKRVATWHDADGGALMDEPVTISQRASIQSVTCLDVEILTNLGPDGDLTLEIDFGDDGFVDVSAPVPANRWQDLRLSVENPEGRSDARFRLIKRGSAEVIVAHLAAFEGCSRVGGAWWSPDY